MAYVAVIVEARLAAFDRSLEEAALDLGAFDDLVIASFTSGPAATTLPKVIFSSVRLGVSPQINALATVILVTVAVVVTVAGKLMASSARRCARRFRTRKSPSR